LLTSG
jgi:hypothetical protein